MSRERREKDDGLSRRDIARRRLENKKRKGGSWSVVQLPEGVEMLKVEGQSKKDDTVTYLFDILQYPLSIGNYLEGLRKGDLWHEFTYYVHANIGAENATRLCLGTFKKPCPICERRQQLIDNGGKFSDPDVKALNRKERQLFNVIDPDDKKAAIKVLDMSYHLFGKMLDDETAEDESYVDFPLLKGGYTIKARFGTKSIPNADGSAGHSFWECKRIDFKERGDYGKEMLDKVIDLPSCLVEMSYDKLKAEFMGEDYEEQEEEERPRGRKAEDSSPPKEETRLRRFDDDDDEPEEKSSRAGKDSRNDDPEPEQERKRSRKESNSKTCPVKDGVFGEDNDIHDECAECSLFNSCEEEYKELKKAKKKK